MYMLTSELLVLLWLFSWIIKMLYPFCVTWESSEQPLLNIYNIKNILNSFIEETRIILSARTNQGRIMWR
jgi:hypothetical protein